MGWGDGSGGMSLIIDGISGRGSWMLMLLMGYQDVVDSWEAPPTGFF